nr:hypothetical protein [Tanacetum cinerariifolium]
MYMTIDQQVALDEALIEHLSKKSTLQLVYDVLRLTPFYKAFLVTADVPEIYMQGFWATAMVHHHSIWFKMDNKKRIVNLEYFREMMHICPRLPGQKFDDLPFEEEILEILRFLRHNGEIRKLTDVNINKLHQPWRSFAAIINKCLSGKSTSYDSLRLSQAQILWGLYHKKNVDFAYLLWEDFVYQVEHKDAKKSNEMYYPMFTKMFTTIKLVSRHLNTQQFGVMLPIELTNEDIRNSEAYKGYYAVASGATPPKTKARVRKTKSSSDTSITPPTAAAMTEAEQLQLATKRSLQQTHISQASGLGADEGTGIIPGVPDVPTEESDEKISWKSSDEEDDDDQDSDEEDDEGNDDENIGLNIGSEEGQDAEDDEDELYRDVNINLEGRVVQMADVHTTQEFEDTHVTLTLVNPDGQQQSSYVSSQFVTSMLYPTPDAGIDSLFETTSLMDVQAPTTVASLTLFAPTLTPLTIATTSIVPQALTPPTTALSNLLQDLPNFGSLFGFDHRLKTLEDNFSEFSDRLRDEAQAENEEFLKNLDENIQKIIKEQVIEQVKVQVSKILLKIENTVNEQLEAGVLTRSSNSSKTSYAVIADLSEMELKKILIEKMEGNKSIHRSDEQRNLYKALVGAYESDKIILDTYRDIVTLKRRHDDDADKDEEPSAGSDRGSKRRREGKEPEIKRPGQLESLHKGLNHNKRQQKKPPTPDRDWNKTFPATHRSIQPWISELAKQAKSRSSFNELMDTPVDFSAFLMNRLKVDTLTPELLAGPTYELMKRLCKSLMELEFFLEEVYKATTDQLDWNNPEGQESARDVYSKRRIITVTELQIVEWLRIQDIEDMLLLLVQGKLTNLMVEERFAFNVSLRMFTRSIVIHRRVEDLQLGVKSYQKKLNLIKPDTYHSDLKCTEAYTAYSNPRGFIYQNKDKQNRLMRIDELHKFSDGTLNDVRTALDDRLKGIRMKYLPQTIWKKSDKERAAAMIQVIDKQLKTRRIMRSLEKFIGGRLYDKRSKSENIGIVSTEMELILEHTHKGRSLRIRRILKDEGEGTCVQLSQRFITACSYPTINKDLGFIGYAPSWKGYRIYNKRTRRIMETIHVQFDDLPEPMALVRLSTGPSPTFMTHGQISSGLVPNPVPTVTYVPLTNKDMEILFQPMFDEYLKPPYVERPDFPALTVLVLVNSAGTPSSTTIDQDAPSLSHSPSSSALQSPSLQQGVAAESTITEDNPLAHVDKDPFVNVFAPEPSSEASSSGDVSAAESTYAIQTHYHLRK